MIAFIKVLKTLGVYVINNIKSRKFKALILLGIVGVIVKLLLPTNKVLQLKTVSQFLEMIKNKKIAQVLVRSNYIVFSDQDGKLFKTSKQLFPKQMLFKLLKESGTKFTSVIRPSTYAYFSIFFGSVIISSLLFYFITSDRGPATIQKQKKGVQFVDVIGLDRPKTVLMQVIQYIKNPQKFSEIGARMRKGLILYGPPGTGKTSLAKACANQAKVNFYACTASEFCQIYVGVGPKKIRQLFAKARQTAPSIIFIDQIDAIGARKNKLGFDIGSDSQRNSTINQLLSEMDGFNSQQHILVIAATNNVDLIDKSLLRPGRFDLKIYVPLPNQQTRQQIFNHYMKNKKSNLSQQFITKIAQQMKGWSGADIQNLTNQSIYRALRNQRTEISQQDIKETLEELKN